MKVIWSKPFKRLEIGDSVADVLVGYQKEPIEYQSEDMGDGKFRQYVSKWRRLIYINLWIVKIIIDL